MSTRTLDGTTDRGLTHSVIRGAIAGLGGGLVFGMLMAMMGILPTAGMLVGQQDAFVGLAVHLVNSAIIGASYGVIAGRLSSRWPMAVVVGAVYGMVWWVLGALVLMPVLLGMTQMVFVIGSSQLMSLMGHVIYGMVTGVLFARLSRQA